MRRCVFCWESYDSERTICPFCGCPADEITLEKAGFPESLGKQYELLEVWSGSGGNDAYLLEDRATRQQMLVKSILTMDQYRHLQRLEDSHLEHVPEILAMEPPEGKHKGYYLYTAPRGETLFQLLEHENPLGIDASKKIIREMHGISEDLHELGFTHGSLTPHSFALTQNGIELIDLGTGNTEEPDEDRVRRIGFRLLRGRWPNEQEEKQLSDTTLHQLMHQQQKKQPAAQASYAAASSQMQKKKRGGIALPAVIAAVLIIAALACYFALTPKKRDGAENEGNSASTEAAAGNAIISADTKGTGGSAGEVSKETSAQAETEAAKPAETDVSAETGAAAEPETFGETEAAAESETSAETETASEPETPAETDDAAKAAEKEAQHRENTFKDKEILEGLQSPAQ